MKNSIHISAHDKKLESKTMLGFWIYLMTDCVLFASLFATYIVLRNNTFGGPSGAELFDLEFVLVETLILLTSSFTCGLAIVAMRKAQRTQMLIWLGLTLALGVVFLAMEISEFKHLIASGNDWQRSGFLSAFFTLIATHGLHIAIGILWAIVLVVQLFRKGFTAGTTRRFALFGMFWHFLDIIWIFIFTIVYLMGAL